VCVCVCVCVCHFSRVCQDRAPSTLKKGKDNRRKDPSQPGQGALGIARLSVESLACEARIDRSSTTRRFISSACPSVGVFVRSFAS